jgi:hypothetical protein
VSVSEAQRRRNASALARVILCSLGAPEPLGEVVVVGVSGSAVQPTESSHEVFGARVVILDALGGIELGAAFIGGSKPQGTVVAEETMPQVAELNVPVDGRGQVEPRRWLAVPELTEGGHEVGLRS